jgi:hypothetical protein
MKDQKNMYPRKTRHEKSRRIIYKFSYKMGVLNEKRCKAIMRYIQYIKDDILNCIFIRFFMLRLIGISTRLPISFPMGMDCILD